MKNYIAEFIGTFFLVLTVALTGNPLAIGVVLTIMIYSLGYISGGHFNPAVTVAVFIYKKIKLEKAVGYILSQFIGGIAASIIYYLITNKTFTTGIPIGVPFLSALLIEIIFTFALVLVVFNVAVSQKTAGNQYYGLAIGLTIFVAATAGGVLSGGAFNPAVGVSPLLVNLSQIGLNLNNILLYILGPITGSIIAVFVYKYMDSDVKSGV